MTVITVTRIDGRIAEVVIKGHSGYAKYGKDIVCAAVSATAQTALLGILKYSQDKASYTINDDGYMYFTVPRSEDAETNLRLETIAETMLIGLKDIADGHKAFVKLEER